VSEELFNIDFCRTQLYTYDTVIMNQELSTRARQALRHIRNAVMHVGRVPSMRELMKAMGYKSPHSALLLIDELTRNGYLERKADGKYNFVKDLKEYDVSHTVKIPLVGSVACGAPILAEENIEALIPVSVNLAKPGSKYFILRAVGDSMDEAGINNGDLVLVRQQQDADNNQKIVALIDDSATIKELRKENDVVMLIPRSSNPEHQPIILDYDFQIQGVVIATIPK